MKEACGIKLYTPAEVRIMLGVGKNKIYELLRDGQIEYIDLNGKMMITEGAIRAGLEKMTIKREAPRLYPRG